MPVLQKENLVCARVPVAIDTLAGWDVLGSEHQMRRAAVVAIDSQDKWARPCTLALRTCDGPPGPPLALVLLENEGSDAACTAGSVRRDGGCAFGGTCQHCTDSHSRKCCSHGASPRVRYLGKRS